MKFRLKAFGLHFLASASILTLVLGSLYFGWYRWPGWYLADAAGVVAVLISVDVTLGPLMTLIVARSTKPRAELMRDIAIIATVQLCALVYGAGSLWYGRPLYYAFSVDDLELVQANDISAHELALGRQQHAQLQPHWYSLPRWIWAPLPNDPVESRRIVMSAIDGGDDVTAMPRYFKRWKQGLPALRAQLKKVDDVAYFSRGQKDALKARMRALGLPVNQLDAMPLTGRGEPLLVVFDPVTLKMQDTLAPPRSRVVQSHHWVVQRYLRRLVGFIRASV